MVQNVSRSTRRQPDQSSTNPTREAKKPGKRASKKRNDLDGEYTILTIDQTRQALSMLIYAWFPEGERPSLPVTVTGTWDSIKLLGAVSDSGEDHPYADAEREVQRGE